jgi:hypothetical protein
MAMATGWFGLSWEGMVENTKAIDLDSDTLKGQLHTDTFTPNFETHDFHADLTNEVTGTGYTAGGVTLAGVTSAIAAGTYTFDCNDFSWTTATFTARGDVIVDTTPGSSATNWLIMARTYGSDFAVNNGTFTTQQHASGVWTAPYR